jgi:hypothetical protein
MTRKIHILLFLISACFASQAQTTKTGVLVIGDNSAAIAAAIQSARSGVKTMYLPQSRSFTPVFSEKDLSHIKRIKNYYSLKERRRSKSADSIIALPLELHQAPDLIKSISDTVKNLTINLNNVVDEIKKDGKEWEIRLKGGQKIKAQVVIDASESLAIASMLKIDLKKTISSPINSPNIFENKLFRSTVALGIMPDGASITIPMGALMVQEQENFIIIPKQIGQVKLVNMSAGQAAGTIAAYCAFFKTTTKLINPRVVQGELLAFDAVLIPFEDIDQKDVSFLAFQHLGLSSMIKPRLNDGKFYFDTAGLVKSEDIKSSMREYYTRSQLWFADNKKDTLSIKDVIELIKFNANRGEELKQEIAESWKKSFKLSSPFEPERNITRREFGILVDKYLQPFNIRIDSLGNLLR